MGSRWQRLALLGLALLMALWLGNSSWLYGAPGKPPLLLAHRGLAQTFPIAQLSGSEDTSKLIYPPEHPFLENTLASMAAAFEHGADIVELDVQRTADDQFAVFHDELLEYRTNGQGQVRQCGSGGAPEQFVDWRLCELWGGVAARRRLDFLPAHAAE